MALVVLRAFCILQYADHAIVVLIEFASELRRLFRAVSVDVSMQGSFQAGFCPSGHCGKPGHALNLAPIY